MADGNPEPEFTWYRVEGEGEAEIEGALLTITEGMAGETHTYNCTGVNQIANISHVVVQSFVFSVGKSSFVTYSFNIMVLYNYIFVLTQVFQISRILRKYGCHCKYLIITVC